MLGELENSGLLNILYHLAKKIRARVTNYLETQGRKARVPVDESMKALFGLVVDDLFASETNEGKPKRSVA